MDNCYCRGHAICEAGHHICTNCTCENDGAPQTREEVTAGWTPPTTHFEKATR